MADQALANTQGTRPGVTVDCLYSVLREIRDMSLEGDASGILLGTKDDSRVRILAFRRMVPKRVLGRSGTLSETDRESLMRLLWGPPADNELYGLEPVGWFHAQPHRDLELSPWELELLNTFFTEGRQVGMVVRSASFGPARTRFYVREPGGFTPNVFREMSVPAATNAVMLTVEPEAPQPERPAARQPGPELPNAERPEARFAERREAPRARQQPELRYGERPEARRPQRPEARLPERQAVRPKQRLEPRYAERAEGRNPQRREPLLPPLDRLPKPGQKFESRRGARRFRFREWRTVAFVAIAAFVLGYLWLASLRHERAHEVPPSPPNLAADTDRQVAPPVPSEELAKLNDALRADNTRPVSEFPDLTRDLAQKPLLQKEEITAPPDEPPSGQQRSRERLSKDTRRSADRSARAQTESNPDRALRPLPRITPPPQKTAAPDLAPPPQVAHEVASAALPPLPQSFTVTPPAPAPKSSAAPTPSSGTLIWTGRLQRNVILTINGKNASFGTLVGELPGKPVEYRIYPGDLGDNGILVFTASQQDSRKGWDSAGPQNGWNRVMYEYDPRHAGGVQIEEAPGPGNSWKRLVLRCINPRLSVIYIKWSLAR